MAFLVMGVIVRPIVAYGLATAKALNETWDRRAWNHREPCLGETFYE